MSALPSPRTDGPGSVHFSDDLADLTAIFEPHIQMAIWQRELPDDASAYLSSLDLTKLPGWRGLLRPGQAPDLPGWPAALGLTAWQADIALLSDVLAELMGTERLGLRLEVLNRPMCPRYHVDQVGVRLLCTYVGAGTEWREGEQEGQLDRGAVALIKGSGWPENIGAGLDHRSPDPAGQPRVLIAIDAVFEADSSR